MIFLYHNIWQENSYKMQTDWVKESWQRKLFENEFEIHIVLCVLSSGWVPDPLWVQPHHSYQTAVPDRGSPAPADPAGRFPGTVPGADRGRGAWETPALWLPAGSAAFPSAPSPRPAAGPHVGHHQHQTLLQLFQQRTCSAGARQTLPHSGELSMQAS